MLTIIVNDGKIKFEAYRQVLKDVQTCFKAFLFLGGKL